MQPTRVIGGGGCAWWCTHKVRLLKVRKVKSVSRYLQHTRTYTHTHTCAHICKRVFSDWDCRLVCWWHAACKGALPKCIALITDDEMLLVRGQNGTFPTTYMCVCLLCYMYVCMFGCVFMHSRTFIIARTLIRHVDPALSKYHLSSAGRCMEFLHLVHFIKELKRSAWGAGRRWYARVIKCSNTRRRIMHALAQWVVNNIISTINIITSKVPKLI